MWTVAMKRKQPLDARRRSSIRPSCLIGSSPSTRVGCEYISTIRRTKCLSCLSIRFRPTSPTLPVYVRAPSSVARLRSACADRWGPPRPPTPHHNMKRASSNLQPPLTPNSPTPHPTTPPATDPAQFHSREKRPARSDHRHQHRRRLPAALAS